MEPAPLTFQVNVHDGAQKAHIVVIVESIKPRVRDDLQHSVMFPQRAICNTDCVSYHQPVSHFKHVVPAQSNTSVWWWEVRCNWSKSPADSGYKDVKEMLYNISVTLFNSQCLTQQSSEQRWWPSEGRWWHLHKHVSLSSVDWHASPTCLSQPKSLQQYVGFY